MKIFSIIDLSNELNYCISQNFECSFIRNVKKMKGKIWTFLTQILCYKNNLVNVIKPFFENLRNESINDKSSIQLLKTFSKDQITILYKNGIITEEKYHFLISNKENLIEEIILEDNAEELQKIILEKGFGSFNNITQPFQEIERMKIPLIQYCIIKNAKECFKYLLSNGFDNPSRMMEEQNPNVDNKYWKNNHRYEWDCMATAIYMGNKEIIKILEDKGTKPIYLEAAILSYNNLIVEEILEELNNNNEKENFLNIAFLAASKNIKGAEMLISKGANIKAKDINYLKIILL